MCATCSHPSCLCDEPITLKAVRRGKVRRFGLDLDQAAFDRLEEALERVNEAERQAWRNLAE